MREKLRNTLKGVSSLESQKLKVKFKTEANQLAGTLELPQPLSFYLSLFNTAVDVIEGKLGAKDQDYFKELLQNQYVDFSKAIIQTHNSLCQENQNYGISGQVTFTSKILNQQKKI